VEAEACIVLRTAEAAAGSAAICPPVQRAEASRLVTEVCQGVSTEAAADDARPSATSLKVGEATVAAVNGNTTVPLRVESSELRVDDALFPRVVTLLELFFALSPHCCERCDSTASWIVAALDAGV